MGKQFFLRKLEDSSKLSTRYREHLFIIPNSMIAIILRLLVDTTPLTFNKGDYDGSFRQVAILADDMCELFYGFKYVLDESLDKITFSLDTERVNDLKKVLLKYFEKVTTDNLYSNNKETTEWNKLKKDFIKSLEGKLLNKYMFSALEYIPIILYEYLLGNILIDNVQVRFCRDYDKDGSARIYDYKDERDFFLYSNDDFIKIKALIDMSNFKTKQLTIEESEPIERLKKELRLTDDEISVLRACTYLMNNYYNYKKNDNDKMDVTNGKISEYLYDNNIPISKESIKQHTRNIKDKCVITGIGVPSIVPQIQQKGYIIPPLYPKKK